MSPTVLLVAFTMNAVISQLPLRRATNGLGGAPASLSALWLVYGEALSPLQWIGIVLVPGGVVCITQGEL